MQHDAPFEQPTIYAAHADPQQPVRRFNWWGFWGLLMATGSFLTAGFASPLAMLVCVNGLRKSKGPRKAALAGTALSTLGILMASSIVMFAVQQEHAFRQHRIERQRQTEIAALTQQTQATLNAAKRELNDFRTETGHLPSGIDGNMLILKHVDAWGTELRYDAETSPTLVRSAGPDQLYNTNDDVTAIVKGDQQRVVSIEFKSL